MAISDSETTNSEAHDPHALPIVLPDLGVAGQTIRVSTWLAHLGEDVFSGEPVVEVRIKGLTFDVEAPTSGTLQLIQRFESSDVQTGDILGWILAVDEVRS